MPFNNSNYKDYWFSYILFYMKISNAVKYLNRIIILFFSISFYSCATMIENAKHTTVEIHTIPDSAVIRLDNLTSVKSPVILLVPKSHKDFNVSVKNDSIEKVVRIKSRYSPWLKFNSNFSSDSDKIFIYDHSIFIDMTNKTTGYNEWKAKQSKFYARISLPWFNYMQFDNGRGFNNYDAYLGLIGGLDYYHSKHSFLSLNGGITGFTNIAFPAMDIVYGNDTIKKISSYCIKLTNNHDFGAFSNENIHFTVGYGLSFTHFGYRESFHTDTVTYAVGEYKKSVAAFGLCFDAHIVLCNILVAGYNILPSFYSINRGKWESSFLEYYDIGFRIPIRNHNKKKLQTITYKPKLID
jgi:hypothetical protein